MNDNNEKLVAEAGVMYDDLRELLVSLKDKGDTESIEILRKVALSSHTVINSLVRTIDVLSGEHEEQLDIVLDVDRKSKNVFIIIYGSNNIYPLSMFFNATGVKLWKREGTYMILKHCIPVGIVGGVTRVKETWY